MPERSVPLFRQHLRLPPVFTDEQLKPWLQQLDSPTFKERENALRQLEAAENAAEPLLRAALAGQPSAELRQRVEHLLNQLKGPVTRPELLRAVRAVEVLEHCGTADARELLMTLANGVPTARQTREARAAAQRLAERRRVP